MQMFRWLAVFPGAIFGAWIVYIITKFLSAGFTTYDSVKSSLFWMIVFIIVDCVCHYAMGAAFILIGIKIAPSYKKHVSFTLATMGIMFMGAAVFINLTLVGYREVLAAICCTGGIVSCLWQLWHNPDFFV